MATTRATAISPHATTKATASSRATANSTANAIYKTTAEKTRGRTDASAALSLRDYSKLSSAILAMGFYDAKTAKTAAER